ncbi:hypothetical protein [Brevibacillus sp. NRS-1366]|uniref:hypothetical protein n=1 Tax=Brevibacillus sp. NRS-1366 TaxID=3233899 RepID=UPI003D20932A
MRQYEKTMAWIESLAKEIPGFEKMLEIKGVGLISTAGFIGEIDDVIDSHTRNRFKS